MQPVGDKGRTFNLSFRPPTYWPDATGTKTFIAGIKGSARRRIAHTAITGGLPGVPEDIFDASLSDEGRKAWGGIDPTLMGGEYLPDLEPDEVEIARLELASTTGDVIAVRAHRRGGHIQYRVVDEYDYHYVFFPERSELPLTLGELVVLLDRACLPGQNETMEAYGLVEGNWEWNFRTGDSPEQAAEFVSVSSSAYPGLADYYRTRAEQWIAISRTNPLSSEAVAALESGWANATPEKREVVSEFLRSHGYQRGWFARYGARDLTFVLSLLAEGDAGRSDAESKSRSPFL